MALGPDGHEIPEKQGVVDAVIQPIKAKDLIGKGGAGFAVAKGVALYLPTWETPPTMLEDGSMDPASVVCTELTLEKAGEAARRVLKLMSDMPLNELAVDLMNLAAAICHYENKGTK
jgi:hypothetical protein